MIIEGGSRGAVVETILHGERVVMPANMYHAYFSPYAVRYRVGRLLFGERYAPSFAAGRFGPR